MGHSYTGEREEERKKERLKVHTDETSFCSLTKSGQNIRSHIFPVCGGAIVKMVNECKVWAELLFQVKLWGFIFYKSHRKVLGHS